MVINPMKWFKRIIIAIYGGDYPFNLKVKNWR